MIINDSNLLEVRNLERYFDVSPPWLNRVLEKKDRAMVKAVDGLDFHIPKGQTLSLVGESGCGKSTVARVIVGLYPPSKGSILFSGTEIGNSKSARKIHQSRMQMIFQDPFASLNPRWRVNKLIAEPILAQKRVSKTELDSQITKLLNQVGLSEGDKEKYPHEFSGGQRQRISISRALAGEPEFLVCDEPTSALDVSVQAQILNLMKDLQNRLGLTYLFISHDLAVVYHVSNRVGVMYLGRLVEIADTQILFKKPRHPYTKMLLDAIPDLNLTGRQRIPVAGEVPSPINPPSGCPFHPRCPHTTSSCQTEKPLLRETTDRLIACHEIE